MFWRQVIMAAVIFGIGLGSTGGRAAARSLRKSGQITVKSGYIDAHFAVSPNGRTLAYVHVGEGRAPTTLNFVSLRAGLPRGARANISKYTIAPLRLQFTPDSRRLMVVSEMEKRVAVPWRQAAFFEANGRQVGKITRFHEIVFRRTRKGWQIVTYLKTVVGQRVTHEVTTYSATNFRRAKTARLVSNLSGNVRRPDMEIAFWMSGFRLVVAKVAGAYDRKRDVRLPDREKIYNPFTRKFVSDREIGDLAAWTRLRKLRAKHQAAANLIRLTGTQKRFGFELITAKNKRVKLPDTSPSLKRFNFDSFSQQRTYGKSLIFSLTVDPQWPTLFGDRRNVPEVFHLFRLDLGSRRAALLGAIPSPNQVLGWSLGGQKLVIMRLHRYWKLGHKAIEVYDVPRR